MLSLIIEIPEIQSNTRKYSYAMVTFIFWSIYFYLWLPLISLIAWGFGFSFFYQHMIKLGGYEGLLASGRLYFTVVLIMSALFIAWAKINLYRFDNVERRKGAEPIGSKEQAQYYKLDQQEVEHWKSSDHLVIYHDDDGYPLKCDKLLVVNKKSKNEEISQEHIYSKAGNF